MQTISAFEGVSSTLIVLNMMGSGVKFPGKRVT